MRVLMAATILAVVFLTCPIIGHTQVAIDSTFCAGAELYGVVPDPQNLYHLYGTRPGELNIGSEFVAFANTFDLYVMDGVVSRWGPDSVRVFCGKILDDAQDNSYDIFPRIWAYFCHADGDPSYEGISVDFGGGVVLNKISIYLYDTTNINCNLGGYYYECRGDNPNCYGASYVPGYLSLVINASQYKRQYGVGCSLRTVDNVVRRGFGHEMQHACFNANGFPPYYINANESLATLSEWISHAVQEKGVDVSYDSSVLRNERCDPYEKYYVEQTWMVYLYEAYDGGNSDITDDLVYRWIRKLINGQNRITMHSLAAVLSEPDFAWVGGASGDERLANVFQGYAVAKYANATDASTDGRFGYRNYDPQREVAMFKDEATYYWGLAQNPPQTPVPPTLDCPLGPAVPLIQSGNWNVRILPPEFVLGSSLENQTRLVSGIYTLDVPTSPLFDGSRDVIDIGIYGTDYIVFRADTYFQDGHAHEFHCDLREVNPAPGPGYQPKVWAIGYDIATGDLTQEPGHVQFVQPVSVVNNNASLVVTDFGGSIKSVVLAVTLVESQANDIAWPTYSITSNDTYYFTYEYEFGVTTTSSANATWNGTALIPADVTVPAAKTLTIAPGTVVRIATSDAGTRGADHSKVEFNVEGTLVADGTQANPIVFESWDPQTTEDWVGFYFDNQSGGGVFDKCEISRAEYAIESYVPLTVKNTTIENCRYGGIVSEAGGGLIQNSTLSYPGSFGIFLTSGTATVRNTTVDHAVSTGLQAQPNAVLIARTSQFTNNDTGVYLSGAVTASIDSTCVVTGNTIGIHCYDTGTTPTIKGSTVSGNNDGIDCDYDSAPLIDSDVFHDNGYAITCTNGSSPTLKHNQITSNASGIRTATGSLPTISNSSNDYNTIASSTSYHVLNWDENLTLGAEYNCWGKSSAPCGPKASKIYGYVDTDNPICCTVGQQTSPAPQPDRVPAPAKTRLVAIVPNPFNPITSIHYDLASAGSVRIRIYDVSGRLVREVISGHEVAGSHEAVWNGLDGSGNPAASGIYFVKMEVGHDVFTRKMGLLK